MISEQTLYRTLWLSDIHLGCKDCKAEYLIEFLMQSRSDKIVLAGDIIDLWALKRQPYWPASHSRVLELLIEKSQQGCEIIYVPGNHDAALRGFAPLELNIAQVTSRYVHQTVLGQQVLVIHGDEFDGVVCPGRLMSWLGDLSYDLLMWLNRWTYRIRRRFGYRYWSLAGYLKTKVKNANQAIERFRSAAFDLAKRKHVDMIVCGHIHHPEIVTRDQVTYCNLGDWVENCSVLVERLDGAIELLHVSEQQLAITAGCFQTAAKKIAA